MTSYPNIYPSPNQLLEMGYPGQLTRLIRQLISEFEIFSRYNKKHRDFFTERKPTYFFSGESQNFALWLKYFFLNFIPGTPLKVYIVNLYFA